MTILSRRQLLRVVVAAGVTTKVATGANQAEAASQFLTRSTSSQISNAISFQVTARRRSTIPAGQSS